MDRSGTSTNNNVYMLASVQPTGFSTGSEVMFVRSTNGGQSFSAAKRVNDDQLITANGIGWEHSEWRRMDIDCVWLDTRNAANNTDSQLFYSYSMDAGIPGRPVSQ